MAWACPTTHRIAITHLGVCDTLPSLVSIGLALGVSRRKRLLLPAISDAPTVWGKWHGHVRPLNEREEKDVSLTLYGAFSLRRGLTQQHTHRCPNAEQRVCD